MTQQIDLFDDKGHDPDADMLLLCSGPPWARHWIRMIDDSGTIETAWPEDLELLRGTQYDPER